MVFNDKYLNYIEYFTYYGHNNNIINQGYSLSILLKEMILEIIDHPDLYKMTKIIIELAELENMVTKSTFEYIYISAFISIFKKN